MRRSLTPYILLALLLGLLVGWICSATLDDGGAGTARLRDIVYGLGIVTATFLRLIKMIIAPLVFSTLVAGLAHMRDKAMLGRVGLRVLLWFVGASFISLLLGLLLVNVLHPGVGLNLPLPPVGASTPVQATGFDMAKFLTHIVPSSIIEAMAGNDVLPIVIFSLFFGIAIAAVGDAAAPVLRGVEALMAIMLKMTGYVMQFAPIAVFAAVAGALADRGPRVIGQLGYFMGSFYLGLAVLWVLLIGLGYLVIGRRIWSLLSCVRAPLLLAFSTASSEAAYPQTLAALERFGVPGRIGSFVLPLGYSFNLDGTMTYMTFASLFVAQAYGIPLSLGQQFSMLLVLMVTSKGSAGVPRASLVIIAAVMPMFGIPDAGLLLILAVDHFLDMARTATNVLGNAIAASVVTQWEGALGDEVPLAGDSAEASAESPMEPCVEFDATK
ncbi:dicarboxylate/amino acid:cation symporter [Sphingomonas oligophenolica]|uniref:Dicarboxylate/amino acid:cation symporter n=1 Tax=Sphingomonas oligophenolica TaxID=301154 RepID=A0ABU9Y6E3_9SPHN